jgi:shikimate kinase
MIQLVGPGGAGKSTTGALLAERLGVVFRDLDRHFNGRFGDISEYIGRHGYEAYARENVETCCSLFPGGLCHEVMALSSGFMTYAPDIHPQYLRFCRELERSPTSFVLLPSLDRELCVAETVRRQIARPFGRPPAIEEAVIQARFETYMAVPVRKIETMRPVTAVVDAIVAALCFEKAPRGGALISRVNEQQPSENTPPVPATCADLECQRETSPSPRQTDR